MTEEQKTEIIDLDTLLSKCATLKEKGYRLVQIGCTETETEIQINYTFDKNYEFINLRLLSKRGESVPSIQSVYDCAFIYENEIAELFGINVTDMPIDFKGKLYKTAVSAPFALNPEKQEEIL
ncbi:MAG: NADH-quinone oxidoreductase subunit C [Bacillota bacterium]|nr:NADH-quinone oxidoreductase subunit C [Bacillota bacterium]